MALISEKNADDKHEEELQGTMMKTDEACKIARNEHSNDNDEWNELKKEFLNQMKSKVRKLLSKSDKHQ